MRYVMRERSDASNDPEFITPEASNDFDPDEIYVIPEPVPVMNEKQMQEHIDMLTAQLHEKQQQLDAQKLQIDAQKIEIEILHCQHKVAITDLKMQVGKEVQEKVDEIMLAWQLRAAA